MKTTNRIVIGLDFEPDGDAALNEAVRVAEGTEGAELHLVHVIGGGRNTEKMSGDLEGAMSELRERIRRVAWPAGSIYEIRLHVRFGDVAAALHQVAVDYDAHLIVVGTHGRNAVARAMLGSVAEELVRNAKLPVLVARPRALEGLPRTAVPAPGTPGADVHRTQHISEAIRIGPRISHISGLV